MLDALIERAAGSTESITRTAGVIAALRVAVKYGPTASHAI
jgi:hypothetical protein